MQQSGFFGGRSLPCTQHNVENTSRVSCGAVQARYKGKNTDRSKVLEFQRHATDTGSSEVQIALLSARVTQLSTHLKSNRKDYATRRGLEKILARRRHFMQYLYDNDRSKYENVISTLGIRSLRIQAGQNVVVKATEDGLVVDSDARSASEGATESADNI